ncbi:methyltransferase domain-containing protein [Hansschlegelia sp. KR7-227]|uniref:methyltransferase domain-containing protein n=1 Tax=Hansschlegelia sp. KR7-227 TaxID=3400914 RepID=UPI003BFF86CF
MLAEVLHSFAPEIQLFEGQIIVGLEGHLFLAGGAHAPFLYKLRQLDVEQSSIDDFGRNIVSRNDYLKERSIPYVHAIAPDKESVLAHLLPAPLPLQSLIDVYKQRTTVEFLDLRPDKALGDHFLATDTHWSVKGQLDAVIRTCRALGVPEDDLTKARTDAAAATSASSAKYAGDLGSRFTPKLTETRDQINLTWLTSASDNNVRLGWNNGAVYLYRSNRGRGRRLLIFGDSFFRLAAPLFNLVFDTVMFCRTEFFHKEMVDMFKPTHVVTQQVERYLSSVKPDSSAPIFLLIPFLSDVEFDPTPFFWRDMNSALSYNGISEPPLFEQASKANTAAPLPAKAANMTRPVFSYSNVPNKSGSAFTVRARKVQSVMVEGELFPVPPPDIMQYGESPESHLQSGKRDYDIIRGFIERHDVTRTRLLDFSCSNSRVLRWFERDASVKEAWGVDIDARRIGWCLGNITGPKFHFATLTTAPHLPFSDASLDFLTALSVFTHLDDTWTGWLAEIRRVLRIGGHALLTLNDEECSKGCLKRNDMVGKILTKTPEFGEFMSPNGLYSFYVVNDVLFTAISRKVFERVITPFFEIKEVSEIMGGQSGYLIKRVE